MDRMNSLLNICLIISCLFQSGVSANSMISCPSTFLEEEPSNLQLTIVNSTFSVCSVQPTTVTCRWSPVNATESVICSGSVTSCEKDATSGSCPCVEESGQGFNYSFDFSMLPEQKQGSITCDLDCLVAENVSKATVESGPNCQNIKFVSRCVANNPCLYGVCRIDANGDAVCDCTGTAYGRPICKALNAVAIGFIVTAIVFFLGVAAAWFICRNFIEKKQKLHCVKTEGKLQTKVGKKEVADKLKEKTSSSLGVTILRASTEDLTAIVLESRNAFHLRTAQKQIFSEFSSLKTPSSTRSPPGPTPESRSSSNNTTRGSTPARTGSHDVRVELPPDYSVGSQKSNNNSERLQMEETPK